MVRPNLYLNPEEPFTTASQKITRFWYEVLQQIKKGVGDFIDLATEVIGRLPFANLTEVAASRLLGRGSAVGTGDAQEITLGAGITMTGTVLSASGLGGDVTGPASSVDSEIALFSGTTGKVLKRATGTGTVIATAGVYSVLTASGTWTPTLTNTTNLDASTAFLSQWSRAGSVVTFSGRVDMDPTSTGSVVLGLSLPIASAFANDLQAGGTFANRAVQESGAIFADAANARLTLQFVAVSTTTQSFNFSGSYLVI